MRRILVIFLILSLCCVSTFSAYGQSDNDVVKTTAAKPKPTRDDLEKVHLHFDKPYYASGDTVYFKAYVTLGERHQLSDLSGVLHVDLINPANKIEQAVKLQLANGLAWGDFTLPDTLPAGNYRIRAYTRWMLNEDNYFEQVIPIGSVHQLKIPESSTAKAVNSKPDIQFLPEGGNMVVGVRSKIAFKATDGKGLGMNVKCSVTDNTGKVAGEFTSAHLGMGYFELKPEEGKTYKADMTFADGSESSIDLPLPKSKGVVLTVDNDSIPNTAVKIEANSAFYNENKGRDFDLLIYSGGLTVTVQFKLDSQVVSLNVIKRLLQTGVARLTLTSQAGEPLCERLFFIQNYDEINLAVNSDKTIYTTREKVNVKLNASNRAHSGVMGHFSVSVTDESKVPVDENTEKTILTNLLLTSDIKGFVEQPNYYFTSSTDEARKNLDLVMLTHGYRKFEWKQLPVDSNSSVAYLPEKGLEIDGTVKNIFGKPLVNATASLIALPSNQLFSIKTGDKGQFRFSNLAFTDTMQFILQAVNAKGKNNTELVYNKQPQPVVKTFLPGYNQDVTPVMFAYLQNGEKQQDELNKGGRSRMLKEVKIKSIKPDDKYETESLAGAGFADQVIHSKDIGNSISSLPNVLAGKLMGITFSGSGEPGGGGVPIWAAGGGTMQVVVDGVELPPGSSVNYLRANDVETIEVLKFGSAAIYGFRGSHGVLVITRKKGKMKELKDIPSFGVLPITVQGYQKVREFYSPKYESDITYNHPDLRSTIYWKPELMTDKDGNASFNFYNADGKGTYRIVIEGIDEKGKLGRQIFTYKVQ